MSSILLIHTNPVVEVVHSLTSSFHSSHWFIFFVTRFLAAGNKSDDSKDGDYADNKECVFLVFLIHFLCRFDIVSEFVSNLILVASIWLRPLFLSQFTPSVIISKFVNFLLAYFDAPKFLIAMLTATALVVS